MSIVAIVLDQANREEMHGWASYVAGAFGESLDIIHVLSEGAGEADDVGPGLVFDGPEDSDIRSAKVSLEGARRAIADHLDGRRPSLLLMDRRGGRRGARANLAREWFASASCDTICLRFPEDGGRGGGRILIPSAGGGHSRAALRFGKKLVDASEGGELVPLLVEPEVGEVAADVGRARLRTILSRCGIDDGDESVRPTVVLDDDPSSAIHAVAKDGSYDLMLIGASGAGGVHRALFGTLPDRLLSGDSRVAVGVFRRAIPLRQRLRQRIGRWLHFRIPQLDRESRVALFANLESNARWSFDFMALICLATALAALGLMLDSAAVVIGAMLVAPLMTPLLGAGLALVQGNFPLMRECARAILYGFISALVIGVLLGVFGRFYGLTHQMSMRGSPDVPDIAVAFLSGVAAAHCIARPQLSSALAGVAIAAALVPPIATVGITLALGEPLVARGAALLFGTNVVFVILGAASSFFAAGVRASRPDRERRNRVWAQRVLLVLVVSAAVLAIPLGSVLFEKVAGARGFRPRMNATVEESTSGRGKIIEMSVRERSGTRVLEIGVYLPQGAGDGLGAALEDAASDYFGKQVEVRLWTKQFVEHRSEDP